MNNAKRKNVNIMIEKATVEHSNASIENATTLKEVLQIVNISHDRVANALKW